MRHISGATCGQRPVPTRATPSCFAQACRGAEERHRLNARHNSRYAEAEFAPLGATPYRSRMTGYDTGRVRVLDMHESGGLSGRMALRDDAFGAWFACGPGGAQGGWADAVPRLVVLGPGTEFPVAQHDPVRSLRITLRGEALRALEDGPPAPAGHATWLKPGLRRPRVDAAQEWQLQNEILRSTTFAETAAARGVDVAAALDVAAEEIVTKLLALLADASETAARGNRAGDSRHRLVERAIELLEMNDTEPASVTNICHRLRVGERTLQRAFRENRGIGLRVYERQRRLRRVHGAILAEGDRRSITDIAMHFGFWHLGRFAGAYAAMFGCSPSQTRQRVWRATKDADRPAHGRNHVVTGNG